MDETEMRRAPRPGSRPLRMTQFMRLRCRAAVLAVLSACAPGAAVAQGGPPLVTDDPETPGNGHWEINIATITTLTAARETVDMPDADINYGWGDHLQLKLDVPLALAHEDGVGWRGGIGPTEMGIKWRFVDEEKAGVSVSTYPQYTTRWLASSTRRGTADEGHEVFLPIEVSTSVGGFQLDGEIGRALVSEGPSEWRIGGILARECTAAIECMLEVRSRITAADPQTLVNVGVRWKLDDSVAFLGAIGREWGTGGSEQQRLLAYIGLQLLL